MEKSEVESKKEPHPWANFLDARLKAMLWMRNEMKYFYSQISSSLSMDEEQVRSIFSTYDYGEYLAQKVEMDLKNETKTL